MGTMGLKELAAELFPSDTGYFRVFSAALEIGYFAFVFVTGSIVPENGFAAVLITFLVALAVPLCGWLLAPLISRQDGKYRSQRDFEIFLLVRLPLSLLVLFVGVWLLQRELGISFSRFPIDF
ncbi:MAG: hypothetical protein JST16_04995 [Bdellovibrionales bacterium]|nr:hypothetical protein [Bdellovibrionales bacterium]